MIDRSTLYLMTPLMSLLLLFAIGRVHWEPLNMVNGGNALVILQGAICLVTFGWMLDRTSSGQT